MANDADSTSLQASLILKEDFSLYVKWRLKRVSGSKIGLIRDALGYHRFIKHREALINHSSASPPTSQLPPPPASSLSWKSYIAIKCGHAYHLSDPIIVELFPVCEVTAHLLFLHAITAAWDKAGGPRLRPRPHRRGTFYNDIRAAWHMARLNFQRFLALLEIVYEYQQACERKHPLAAAKARRTNCASVALKLAIEDSQYPALLSSSPISPKFGKLLPKGKKVTFATEMQIKNNDHISTSAVKDAHDCTRDMYFRPSKTYKPGDHACPLDSLFLDTSGTKTEPGDINNLKILVTDDQDAFRSLQANVKGLEDLVGEYQGLVGMHTLKQDIFGCMVGFMKLTYGDLWAKRDLEGLMSEADRMAVLIDDETGGVVDIFPFDGSDEDEEDHQSKKRARQWLAETGRACGSACHSYYHLSEEIKGSAK
ncbi:hypothetical protein E8E11_007565 [Didymella keratinophila]|nr:hypothetical protein E8E11_007565 [Didymella keratinophila]